MTEGITTQTDVNKNNKNAKKETTTINDNKLWTKLCQAHGRNYVLISLVIENLDTKLLYKLKDKHVKI